MPDWTPDSLALDAATLRDAEKLALNPTRWPLIGRDARAAWGLAQGSGKDPYRVAVDLADGATKCTCPSRKFPCKHAAALILMLGRAAVPESASPPDWVTTWLGGRQARATAAAAPAKAPDAAAKAKREAAREKKVAAGIDELTLFLEDLVRGGLDDPRVKGYAFWDRIAARMVDAQMTPIARRLRRLGGRSNVRAADSTAIIAAELGQLFALTQAYQRLPTLPDGLGADVRAAIGFALKAEEVIAEGTPVADRWHVVGARFDSVEQLRERRTWLYGETTRQFALIIDFAVGHAAFETRYPIGGVLEGTLVYYPSAYPQRAVIQQARSIPTVPDTPPVHYTLSGVQDMLNVYADALARNPFLLRIPVGLVSAWLIPKRLTDPDAWTIPFDAMHHDAHIWLPSVTGGNWVPVFGEWEGEVFSLIALHTTDGIENVEGMT